MIFHDGLVKRSLSDVLLLACETAVSKLITFGNGWCQRFENVGQCTVEYSVYFRFGGLNHVSTKATELLTKPFGFAWAAHLVNAPHDRTESLLLGFE